MNPKINKEYLLSKYGRIKIFVVLKNLKQDMKTCFRFLFSANKTKQQFLTRKKVVFKISQNLFFHY
jgi:hypothetical protein